MYKNFKRGDDVINIESRFDEIYREYYPVLLRYITSRRLPNIDAEEIAHEALTLLWEKRAECEFESDEQLAAWILRTGKFTAMSRFKKVKAKRVYPITRIPSAMLTTLNSILKMLSFGNI